MENEIRNIIVSMKNTDVDDIPELQQELVDPTDVASNIAFYQTVNELKSELSSIFLQIKRGKTQLVGDNKQLKDLLEKEKNKLLKEIQQFKSIQQERFQHDVEQYKDTVKALTHQLRLADDERIQLEKKIDELESENESDIQQLKNDNQKMQIELDNANKIKSDLSDQLARERKRNVDMDEYIRQLQSSLQNRTKDAEDFAETHNTNTTQLLSLEEKLNEEKSQNEKLNTLVNKLRLEAITEKEQHTKQLESLRTRLHEERKDKEKYEEEYSQLKQQTLIEQNSTHIGLETLVQQLQSELSRCNTSQRSLEEKLQHAQMIQDESKRVIDLQDRQLDSQKDQLIQLLELLNRNKDLDLDIPEDSSIFELLVQKIVAANEELDIINERLRESDIDSRSLIQECRTQINSLNKQIKDNEIVYQGLKHELETVVSNLEEQLKSDNSIREQEREQYKQTVLKLQTQLQNSVLLENDYKESYDDQMKNFSQRQKESEVQKDRLIQQNNKDKLELQQKIRTLSENLNQYQDRNSTLEETSQRDAIKIEELSLEITKLQAIIEQKSSENTILRENFNQEIKRVVSNLKLQNDSLKKQVELVETKHNNDHNHSEVLKKTVFTLQHQLDTSTQMNRQLDEAVKKIIEERNALRYEIDHLLTEMKQTKMSNIDELESAKQQLERLSKKYKSVKEKYFKQSVRQNELQNYLLKVKRKKAQYDSPDYERDNHLSQPSSDAASQTSILRPSLAPSSVSSSPQVSDVPSNHSSPGSDYGKLILAQKLQDFKDLQNRYERQKHSMELETENYGYGAATTNRMSEVYNSKFEEHEANEPIKTYQPIQQLSVTNKATNEKHDVTVGQEQRPRSNGKKLRKKKPITSTSTIAPTSGRNSRSSSTTTTTTTSSRRHSLGATNKSKR
jgi:hypothetical protein